MSKQQGYLDGYMHKQAGPMGAARKIGGRVWPGIKRTLQYVIDPLGTGADRTVDAGYRTRDQLMEGALRRSREGDHGAVNRLIDTTDEIIGDARRLGSGNRMVTGAGAVGAAAGPYGVDAANEAAGAVESQAKATGKQALHKGKQAIKSITK